MLLMLRGSDDQGPNKKGLSFHCRYLDRLTFRASIALYKPVKKKKRSGSGVPAASLMIKLAKGWRRERRELAQLELHTFSSWGVFFIYIRISS